MIILQVHNYYTQAGGEDGVLQAEYELLKKNNQTVSQYIVRSGNIVPWRLAVKFLTSTHYSYQSRWEFSNVLIKEKPDIVHVHNFFPILSPSIYDACIKHGVPVVQTLHNYRIIYPNSYLYHNGKVDSRTINQSAWLTVKDKVYHNSIAKTGVMAHFIEFHKKRNTWNLKVDKFIALTEFAKNVFVQFGIESEKIIVKPNFQVFTEKDNAFKSFEKRGDFVLFVGRISEEKGIMSLVKEWIKHNSTIRLKIAGEGPLFNELNNIIKQSNSAYIEVLGNQSKHEIKNLMNKAKALVFPSLWYEGFPMVLVEALANGLPVITTSIGSQGSIIKHGTTGYHVSVDSLNKMIEYASVLINDSNIFENMCKNAKNEFTQKYTDVINYDLLMNIYNKVIENNSIQKI